MAEGPQEKKNTPLLVGALVVIVGLTAYFATRGGNETVAQLDTAESTDMYVCLQDGETFGLTPAAFERLVQQGKVKTTGSEDAPGVTLVECPKCKKLEGVRAQECPKDQTYSPRRLKDGKPGKCPKCGWSLYGG